MAKLEHFIFPKVGGGGGSNPLVPPTFESAGAQAPAAPLLLRPCGYMYLPCDIYIKTNEKMSMDLHKMNENISMYLYKPNEKK